jgi:hypothetical protein
VNNATLLLQMARNQNSAGLIDAARESLDQAEKEIAAMKAMQSDKPGVKRNASIARCEEELTKIRKLVGTSS